MQILFVNRIVRAKCGGVVVEHHRLVLVRGIIRTEIIYECRQLALKFDVERFTFSEFATPWKCLSKLIISHLA